LLLIGQVFGGDLFSLVLYRVLCRVLSKVLSKGGAGLCGVLSKVRWPKLTDRKGSVHGGAPRLCAEFGSDAEALGRVLSFHGAVAKFGQTLCKVLCGALQRVVQDSVQSEQGARRVLRSFAQVLCCRLQQRRMLSRVRFGKGAAQGAAQAAVQKCGGQIWLWVRWRQSLERVWCERAASPISMKTCLV